ncbi:hypothetical protein SUGI_0248310 [Cryptomeria japonica]|nr:hypothetical protein SUGI_0248310 [Cryptomeria japonica]
MHYAVQAKSGNDRKELTELLLRKCGSDDRRFLFLWASAAGLGTADQIVDDSDSLKGFLLNQKEQVGQNRDSHFSTNNLLKIAACIGDTDMTKELLARGGQIADIEDQKWINDLGEEEKANVRKVLKEIQTIAEQGNDLPTVADLLGRNDFARSLAALLLNPYLEPPIAIGISGSWGKGKSSLMIQTEKNLLETAAQASILPTSKLHLGSSFPGAQALELSRKGKKKYKKVKRWVDFTKNDSKFNTNYILTIIKHFQRWITSIRRKFQRDRTERITEKSQGPSAESRSEESQDSLPEFLRNYDPKYHSIFKSLAAMDRSEMFSSEGQQPYTRIDAPSQRSVPAVLTVHYNAWMYRNESEAFAGLAVTITKEMEGIMTEPQWLSTCLRNTWRKQKQIIWIEVLFPCLLAIFLAGGFTWIVWMLLDRYYDKEAVKLKYSSLPATIVILVWIIVKSVMSIVKPVSSQLMNYIKLANHSEKLGYQETVISDIKFLKEEIGKKPYYICTASSCIWWFIKEYCIIWLFRDTMASSEPMLASTSYATVNPRIFVFVDDLERCQESVILQVLSAINLVLAVCKISVIVGMDKVLIERAILKKYGDKSSKNSQQLANNYLQKIIQLPLDLPDPSEDEFKRFLDSHLGVFSRPSKNENLQPDTHADIQAERDDDYDSLFSIIDKNFDILDLGEHLMKMYNSESSIQDVTMTGETDAATQSIGDSVAIDVTTGPSNKRPSLSISIRDILYMSNEVNSLLGWQVQLIAWVFTCWEWEENMNIIIENSSNIAILKTSRSESSTPSLRAIVEHFIKEESRIIADSKVDKMPATGDDKDSAKKELKIKDLKEKECLHFQQELRKEMDNLHKEIEELKEPKQQSGKNKKSEEEKRTRLKTWQIMRSALKRYDVSMEGIRAFQKFRFYCVAGHLQWPLPKENNEDLRFLQTARSLS